MACLWIGPAAAQQVTIAESGQRFDSFSAALATASPGDQLEVSGTHIGNFTVSKPLKIIGMEGATLDGGGHGTVLVIAADDVTVEALTVTDSGRDSSFKTIWGDAGIRVDGDRATLKGLTVRDNDWGIILRQGQDSAITGSVIEDNARDGIKVMGGFRHRIAFNEINRNGSGVTTDAYYGNLRETIIPEVGDVETQQRVTELKENAISTREVTIADNEVRGNGGMGILVYWKSRRIQVLRNHVFLTGREREPDRNAVALWESALGAASGWDVSGVMRQDLGDGIHVSCFAEENRLMGNHSHDNTGYGIWLSETPRNMVDENRIDGNRVGIGLERVDDNQIERNSVTGNAEYGILIDVLKGVSPMSPSTGNLLVRNTISDNQVNAFDTSDTVLSAADMEDYIRKMPWPEATRSQVLGSKAMLQRITQSFLERYEPGHNRWDDGTLGNHYGDFDEAVEGFTDADGDGIGETPHPIPGGGAVDHFPLTAERATL